MSSGSLDLFLIFSFSKFSPITHPPLNVDPDSIINFSVEISPLIIQDDFNINNSTSLLNYIEIVGFDNNQLLTDKKILLRLK